MDREDQYYIKRWMDFAGRKNLNEKMPEVIDSSIFSLEAKKDIMIHWNRIAPNDYKKYLESIK